MKFDNTRRALAEYEATDAERQASWEVADTNQAVENAAYADELAIRKVQDAFYLDTKDYNSLRNCYLTSIDFLRKLASEPS